MATKYLSREQFERSTFGLDQATRSITVFWEHKLVTCDYIT